MNKQSFSTNKKLVIQILGGLALYLISTTLSFATFSLIGGKPNGEVATPLPGQRESGFRIDVAAPKTEVCPLNGGKFTVAERKSWETKRPIAAMIENSAESRPPSGLGRADIVYEAVAEGGITRFMGVFYCNVAAKPVIVAPVRSSRIYYITWAEEYGNNPLYIHWGGANDSCQTCPGGEKLAGTIDPRVNAIGYLSDLGWSGGSGNDLDGMGIGLPVFLGNEDRLDHPVAPEHTKEVFIDEAYKEAQARGFAFKDSEGVAWNQSYTSWKFTTDSPVKTGVVSSIKFSFWDNAPLYDVEWKYDAASNSYLRFNGNKPHTDLEESNAQIMAKNVVVQYVKEEDEIDKEGHTFIKTVGTGDAIIFQNGKAIEGTWEKASEDGRTVFSDSNGVEIKFVGGPIWIEAVPTYQKAIYS